MRNSPIPTPRPEGPNASELIELEGRLGRDPEIRQTAAKTYHLKPAERPQSRFLFAYGPRPAVPDPEADRPIENDLEFEITRPGRDFAALSLAVARGRRTDWHQLRAFNIDPHHPQSRYRELYALRIARKGDLIRVLGRHATWKAPDGKVFHYIDIVDFRIVALTRRAL